MMFSSVRVLREYKESLKLNLDQQRLIVGSLLGDGNLRFMGRSKEASFVVDHSDKQAEYVWWKWGIMREWVTSEPRTLARTYHKDISRLLYSVRFQTLNHPEFTFWYNVFYHDGTKKIPRNIAKILTSPLSLAVWFMDDGNRNHQAVFLNTQQFEKDEQERLATCLYDNFGLECTLNKHSVSKGRQLYRIRIDTKSTKILSGLIYNHILPSLQYKIPVCPRNDFPVSDRKITAFQPL